MVVAAFALQWLEQDGGDAVTVLREGGLDFGASACFLGGDVVGDLAVGAELDGRVVDPRPVELGEEPDFVGHGIGQREGVAAAAVECIAQVQDYDVVYVGPKVGAPQLARLPVERRLERVFDRQRAAGDPEVIREARGSGAGRERFDEAGHLPGVKVGISGVSGGDRAHFREEFRSL